MASRAAPAVRAMNFRVCASTSAIVVGCGAGSASTSLRAAGLPFNRRFHGFLQFFGEFVCSHEHTLFVKPLRSPVAPSLLPGSATGCIGILAIENLGGDKSVVQHPNLPQAEGAP